MVDATVNDLFLKTKTVSSLKLLPAECSNKSEVCSSERSLSPVLGGNDIHRKIIRDQKRGRIKSRVKLTKRFANEKNNCGEHNKEDNKIVSLNQTSIDKILTELQVIESNGAGNKLTKIREYEDVKKKFSNDLYNSEETKTYVCKNKSQVITTADEFNFKKPNSPVSGIKKSKLAVDVLLENHKLISNSPSSLPIEQDRSCSFEMNDEIVEVSNTKFRGFCTGTGKNIVIPPDVLKKHLKLFEDIVDINNITPNDINENELDCNKPLSKKLITHVDSKQIENVANIVNRNHKENTLDNSKLHCNDDLFMQTSFSDTQMILAADIAMSLVDVAAKDDWTVPSTTSRFHTVALKDNITTNTKGEKKLEIINALDTDEQNVMKRAKNNLWSLNNMENYFKGFKTDECNFVQEINNSYSKFLEHMENSFNKNNNIEIGKNKENADAVCVRAAKFTAGKRSIAELDLVAIKRFKVDHSQKYFEENTDVNFNSKKIVSVTKENDRVDPIFDEDVNSKASDVDFSVCGFKSASNKPMKLSSSLLEKAQLIYNQICQSENFSDCNETNKANTFKETKQQMQSHSAGFSTAGGKNIKISNNAWQKAKKVFSSENPLSSSANDEYLMRSTVNDQPVHVSEANSVVETFDFPITGEVREINLHQQGVNNESRANTGKIEENPWLGGFTTGAGMKIQISSSALLKSEALFADENLSSNLDHQEGQLDLIEATGTPVVSVTSNKGTIGVQKIEKENERNVAMTSVTERKFQPLENVGSMSRRGAVLHVANDKKDLFVKTGGFKKRLGVSACKQISIANDKLQKAKSVFEEFEGDNQNKNSRSASMNSPFKFNQSEMYSSTPTKDIFRNTAVKVEEIQRIKKDCLTNTNITPVKRFSEENTEFKKLGLENKSESKIVIHEPTEGNTKSWLESVNKELEDLQNKIKVICERKKALEAQKQLIESVDKTHIRPIPGVLLKKKQSSQLISMKEFFRNRKPGCLSVSEAIALNVPRQVLEVTPKNAKYVHFNCVSTTNSEQYSSVVYTADGAAVVPSSGYLIGLTEIQTAFETMPGIDSKLLPIGWISNHFRWIVWKLASLERNFPDMLPKCLSVENILQQLKYRYDREIDQAERPALRKILEKDDVPQKRMILCVADIVEISSSEFELDLTDGWYCIRTSIDQPLCKQISTSKIVIGTKLLVQCAEILNCDGCHPLEVPNNVRLKINYNCTRRAAWNSKLGYQKTAEQFPINLRSIHADGGLVACIKIYIARVYPLKYMEKQVGKRVWRNKKAEEKRAQEWENQRIKEEERIHQKVQEDYERELNQTQKDRGVGKVDTNRISEVDSPKLLYQMLENANDPEGVKSLLSPSQLASAMEYRSNIYAYHQQQIATRIREKMKSLKFSQRDVVSILKLKVVDAGENTKDSFNLNIWKPTEEHTQLLKEGRTFSVYNVIPKNNCDLAANSKTLFKSEETLSSKNNRLQRYILPISIVQQPFCKPLFNEYDTVGTVVQTRKNTHCQELWLTDSNGRLLLVKIREGPEQCCLLDNVNRSQSIAIMNLVYCRPQGSFAEALANQCTVITSYPQHKFLQDGIAAHCEQLPQNLTVLMDECDKKIAIGYKNMQEIKSYGTSLTESLSFNNIFDDSCEDNTIIPTRLTTTDVAMSLIDTDQYFENVSLVSGSKQG